MDVDKRESPRSSKKRKRDDSPKDARMLKGVVQEGFSWWTCAQLELPLERSKNHVVKLNEPVNTNIDN